MSDWTSPGLLAICLILSGCAAAPVPPAPTAKRVSLSQAQETAIQTGMAKALKDIPTPVFPMLAAATEPDGAIFICGTAKPESGSYQKATPFALLLRGTDITILTVGGNERDNLATTDLCKSKGINGLNGLASGPKPAGWVSSLFGR